jgi:hypothetical protein
MEMPQEKKSWYSRYYDAGWRWIEDTYLKYFGENRTSYGVKSKSLSLLQSRFLNSEAAKADPPKIHSTRQKSRVIKTWMEFRGALEILLGIYLQPEMLGELWGALLVKGL